MKHEAIADDAYIRAVAKDGAQPAEKFRTVTRQLLYPLCQCDIQALPKIGDPAL
ncbi:MAG: hypothetical protein QM805_13090 [Pseudomonas sp.]